MSFIHLVGLISLVLKYSLVITCSPLCAFVRDLMALNAIRI